MKTNSSGLSRTQQYMFLFLCWPWQKVLVNWLSSGNFNKS